jgi:hypothetical protein
MAARNFEMGLNFIFEIRLPESIFVFQEIEFFQILYIHIINNIYM